MARVAGRDAIYAAANAFRDRCLTRSSSLLWPDRFVWRTETLQALWQSIFAPPDTGDRSFVEKLKDQLASQPKDVHQVAADIAALYGLFPAVIQSPASKRGLIEAIVSWKLESDPPDMSIVEPAFEARGLGHPGAFYNTGRPWMFGYFIQFALARIAREAAPTDLEAIRAVADEATTKVEVKARIARNITLHLLFPDHFEPISSDDHKKLIIDHFHQLAGDQQDPDEAILAIRRELEKEYGPGFWFYNKEIRPQWLGELNDEGTDESDVQGGGVDQNRHAVWMEKTLVRNRADRMSGDYALGHALWSPKEDQRGGDIYRFMREVKPGDVVLHLTDNEAITGISHVAAQAQEFGGVPGTAWANRPCYLVRLQNFETLNPPLSRDVFLESSPYRDRLLEVAKAGRRNLFFNRGGSLNQGAYLTPVNEDILATLNDAYKQVAGRPLIVIAGETPLSPPVPAEGQGAAATIDWLAESTLWALEALNELVAALRTSRQVILAGPPGTGKTWVAKHVARFLTADVPGRVKIVQLHPSYGYEEFVEGLRPVTDERGHLTFRVRSGLVRSIAEDMKASPDQPYVLIIDEMNRANLSRVLGELMYLFEYRDETITLQHSAGFALPRQLLFVGTMNTADRSIRTIDIALRRRFEVFECLPDPRILELYYAGERRNEIPDLIAGFNRLNQELTTRLDRHHQIGHTFLMRPVMNGLELRKIWRRRIVPLLEEYFFDQPDMVRDFALERFWEGVK